MRIVFIRDRLIRDGLQNTPKETRYKEGQEHDCTDDSARYFIGCGDAVELIEQPPLSPPAANEATAQEETISPPLEEEVFNLKKKK